MQTIKREEMIAGIVSIRTIQSATWKRRSGENRGEVESMQFISKIPEKTVNFQRAGGFAFNASSKELADELKKRAGLISVLKMNGEVKAVPRFLPVNDILTWKAEGIEYKVID